MVKPGAKKASCFSDDVRQPQCACSHFKYVVSSYIQCASVFIHTLQIRLGCGL